MQTIATSFKHDGYDFKLVKRNGLMAMFEKKRPHWSFGWWEVVLIQIHAEHTWPSGETSPEREVMPPTVSWGDKGWTFFHKDRDKAESRFEALSKAV
jgi:hypothetical protein